MIENGRATRFAHFFDHTMNKPLNTQRRTIPGLPGLAFEKAVWVLALTTLSLSLLTGCGRPLTPPPPEQPSQALTTQPPMQQGVITGTASFRERMALPADAQLEVTLLDISRADAPATTLGHERIQPVPGPVTSFRLVYDPSLIDPHMRYSVRATIRVGDQLWFTTDTVVPVLTQGYGHHATLTLKRVASATVPAQ